MLHFPRWKAITVWVVIVLGILTALPNVLTEKQRDALPGFLPNKGMTLGLDLQGGAHLLLEVDMAAVKTMALDKLQDDARTAVKGATVNLVGESVIVALNDPATADDAVSALKGLSQPISAGFGVPAQSLDVAKQANGTIRVTFTEAGWRDKRVSATNQVQEVVSRRVDELGTKEPSIMRQGEDRVLVQVPGLGSTEGIKSILQETAVLTFQMVDETVSLQEISAGKRVPLGTKLLPQVQGGAIPVRIKVDIRGDCLTSAQQSFDQNQLPAVSFRFDTACGKKFGRITSQNIGKRFAIVLDGKVISAPVIQGAILGGSGIINGNFTIEEANKLAVLLRAGALPAPIKIVEERTVGPDLGSDSIDAGVKAATVAFIVVMVYLVLTYGFFGMVANLGIVINLVLTLGSLSLVGATLTLPGIAGMVLTMGMSVDANVLINERIREELRIGRSVRQAIAEGFEQASSSILDGNITALLTALILFQFGTGPIKGFAVTLAVGIIWSVFSAVWINRYVINGWVNARNPKTLTL